MSVFISVVSHNQGDLINDIGTVEKLSNIDNIILVIKSNTVLDDFSDIISKSNNIYWLNESYGLGFGENNNYVYQYCANHLGMQSDDFFIVMNPDVSVESSVIDKLIFNMHRDSKLLSTINLFKDKQFYEHDPAIRTFPTCSTFIKSFVFGINETIIDKSVITVPCEVDWAAGSFLAFSANHYRDLGGFDRRYFMYCEDIDICWRSCNLGVKLTYYPKLKATHVSRSANRKFLSKHFIWHIKSAVRFLCVKKI